MVKHVVEAAEPAIASHSSEHMCGAAGLSITSIVRIESVYLTA